MFRIALFLRFITFSFLMGSCQCGNVVPPRQYQAFIFYSNRSGQDLLNPLTSGGFKADSIKLNGGDQSAANFNVVNMANSTDPNLPKGYALTFFLSMNLNQALISLSKKDTDTLNYTYSSATLISCQYNKAKILPPNGITSFPISFPIMVVK